MFDIGVFGPWSQREGATVSSALRNELEDFQKHFKPPSNDSAK
jgi:hypothetical protein